MGRKQTDLTGKIYGRLTVIEKVHNVNKKRYDWKCQCSCGNITIVAISSLNLGRTTSCGCIRNENAKNINKKHGESSSPIWKRWSAMRMRCRHNKKYYVNRGIKVCKSWEDYESFKLDMLDSFNKHVELHGEKNTTLDRIDPDKGYFKENCRWATFKEQTQNCRKSFNFNSLKKVNLLLEEINKLKNTNLELTKDEYLSLSFKIRKQIFENK